MRRESTLPALFLAVILLIYGAALALGSVQGFPTSITTGSFFPYLADKPVAEDGYYMLAVAWNLANGEGLTYNYHQTTTGIQPLSTILDSGLARLVQSVKGGKWSFVRAVQFLGVLYLVIFALCTRILVTRLVSGQPELIASARSLAIAITLFHYGLFRIFTYGLETGLYLILVAVNVIFTIDLSNQKPARLWKLLFWGFLSGLAVLARLDFLVILSVLLLITLIRKQLPLWQAGVVAGVAIIVTSPWLLFVYQNTGNIIPSSGSAQSGLISLSQVANRSWEMLRSIIFHLVPWVYSRPAAWLSLGAVIMLGIFLFFYLRTARSIPFIKSIFHQQPIFTSWFFAMLALVPVYLIGFNATHFYNRYLAPMQIIFIPLISALLSDWMRNFPKGWKSVITWSLPVCFFIWAFITLHTGKVTNSQPIAAGYISKNFPQSTRIGAFQSGVIGYFNLNVFNLDGKVNQGALDAQRENRLAEYIDDQEISVLVDWPEIIHKKLPQAYLGRYWQPCEAIIPDNRTICLVRKQP